MNNETETKPKHAGGRPKLPPAPTTSAEVRALLAAEVVKGAPDRFKCQALTTLLETFEKVEAKSASTAGSEELTAANAKIIELQITADRVPGLEDELSTLKADFDVRVSVAKVELTSESMRTLALAARERNTIESRLREAEQKFSQSGLEALMEAMRELVREYNISTPDFWTLPAKINPLYLSLWPDEWTPRKAAVWCALKSGWTEDSQEFREAALRTFMSAQAQFPDEPPREIPADIMDRRSFFEAAAKRFGNGCYEQIVERSDDYYAARWGEWQQRQLENLQSQQIELARHQGAGRSPIGVAEQLVSPTGASTPLELHEVGCCCPAHSGLPAHLASDPWLGTKHFVPTPEVNEVRPMMGGEEEL